MKMAQLCVALMMFLVPHVAQATDFADSPETAADPMSDIADLYVWTTAQEKVVVVLTFHAGQENGVEPVFNPERAYLVYVDANEDDASDFLVGLKFGQNVLGEWGVFVTLTGLEDLIGPYNQVLSNPEARAWVGPADNPAFIDLVGLESSLASDGWDFDASRDVFAGSNVIAFVAEFDMRPRMLPMGDDTFRVWAVIQEL